MDILGIVGSLASILSILVSAIEYLLFKMRSYAIGHNRTNRGDEPEGVMLREVSRTQTWNLGFYRSTVNEKIFEERVWQRHEVVEVSPRGVHQVREVVDETNKTVAISYQTNSPIARMVAKDITGRS